MNGEDTTAAWCLLAATPRGWGRGRPPRGQRRPSGPCPALLYNIFDPAANIYAALAYGIARYGSIQSIPGVKSIAAGGSYRPYDFVAR